jgi:hypothetical protein
MNVSAVRFLVEHFRRDPDEPLKPPPEPLFVDPAQEAVRRWLASSPHRRNMLAAEFRETGVGVVYAEETGYYYFTQVFLRSLPE